MANDILELLARLTLAGSAAIVLVLLLRRPLRRFAGAGVAYQSWLIVAFAMLAAALPALREAPLPVLALGPALAASTLVAHAAPAGTLWLELALLAWAIGALAAGAVFLLGQRAFVRGLGPLVERDEIFVAANARHGPALLGLWRPIIVVPSDFASRYSEREQALIVAHEKLHAERRDPVANAALALLQCAFWFNPLMHIAASRFRFDQELACDAAVLARNEGQQQVYAAAMLKTQLAGAPALATCHWQSSHPLKERIMHLKQTSSGTPRRRAGRLAIALLACASVLATVAARADTAPAASGDYDVAIQFTAGGQNTAPKMRVKAGEEFQLRWDQPGGARWSGAFKVMPAKDDLVYIKMKITRDNGPAFEPGLMMRLGESGAAEMSGKAGEPSFRIGVVVTRVSGQPPGA